MKTVKLFFNYGQNITPGYSSYKNCEQRENIVEIEGKEIFIIYANFLTREDGETFFSQFPKYCRSKIASLSGGGDYKFSSHLKVEINGVDGSTGSVNETAIKRRKKIFEILTSLGY